MILLELKDLVAQIFCSLWSSITLPIILHYSQSHHPSSSEIASPREVCAVKKVEIEAKAKRALQKWAVISVMHTKPGALDSETRNKPSKRRFSDSWKDKAVPVNGTELTRPRARLDEHGTLHIVGSTPIVHKSG